MNTVLPIDLTAAVGHLPTDEVIYAVHKGHHCIQLAGPGIKSWPALRDHL